MTRSPLVDVAWGYMPARIIAAAAELDIADQLAEGPRTTDELAGATGAHPPTLRRLLRALVALGVLAQADPDRFELTELGGHLRSDAPDSVGSIVRFLCSPGPWQAWGDVMTSLRTGETAFDRLFGMQAFEYLAQHPDEAAVFNAAQAQHTRETAAGLIAGYDFSRFGTVADLGGGSGMFLARLLQAEPALRGVLFDIPSGVTAAPSVLEEAGVADRCEVVTGSFFESVPAGADAYVMKMVLHDWDDEQVVAILRNCRAVLPDEGRVLVVERLVPEMITPDDTRTLLADLLMLVLTGGRERTEAEYRDLLTEAGFALLGVTEPLSPLGFQVLEAAPA